MAYVFFSIVYFQYLILDNINPKLPQLCVCIVVIIVVQFFFSENRCGFKLTFEIEYEILQKRTKLH